MTGSSDQALQLAGLALQGTRTRPDAGGVASALSDAGWLDRPEVLVDVIEVLAHECRRQRVAMLETAREIRTVVAEVTSREQERADG